MVFNKILCGSPAFLSVRCGAASPREERPRTDDQDRLAEIDTKIEEIDAAIAQRIEDDPLLARRFEILLSIPGVARATAFALLIEMPELGALERGQASSLAGLAPVQRQSGTWKGHAFIRGGRAFLRQALYMPALVACRFNTQMKASYARLIEAGKPPKVAITAVIAKVDSPPQRIVAR